MQKGGMELNKVERSREAALIEYWRVIVKRKWVIVTFAVALIFLAGISSFLAIPKYKSTATLLIEDEISRVFDIDETFDFQPQAYRDLRFYNTQIKLLKSGSLAARVVRQMNLFQKPEFHSYRNSEKRLVISAKEIFSFKWLIPKKKSRKKRAIDFIQSDAYSEIIKEVQKNIDVKSIRDTKLVEVSFISYSPVLAAEVVNTLAEEFINFSIKKRYDTTQKAPDFLSEQIADLQDNLAAKEKRLQRYGQEKEIFFLSDTESTVVNKFADLNEAYTKAQIEKIEAESTYRELIDLKVDSLPQFVKNPMIQELKTEFTRILNEYIEKSKIFKPEYPEIIRLKAKLDSMREELKNEIEKAVEAAESEYRSAQKKEASLRNLFEKQKEHVTRINSNTILYNSIKIEVENKRALLNSLVKRQNETLISARLSGLKTSNISIIDKGKVPENPFFPKKKLNLFLAFLMGIFGGVGFCFLFEYLDNTVKGPDDVEKLTGLPSIGAIPYLPPEGKNKKKYGYYSRFKYSHGDRNLGSNDPNQKIKEIELVNYHFPKFFISEDYRMVRTSILLSHADAPPKTIAFLSASPREGKSTTLANMAVSFAQLGEKVLVVDSDLRKPRLHRIFEAKNNRGLSGYLTGKLSLGDSIQKTNVENIWILPSGLIPPNPAELLNSKKMKEFMEKMKKEFDVILLDTPPILAVIDGVIVSTLADSTMIIIRAGSARRKPFLSAIEEIKRANAKIIGVVFNEVKLKKADYHFIDYYRYYRYRYYKEGTQKMS